MDNLFNNVLANVSNDITAFSSIITMLIAVAFGGIIGFTYYKTQEEDYQRSLAVTLLMLPVYIIGNNCFYRKQYSKSLQPCRNIVYYKIQECTG